MRLDLDDPTGFAAPSDRRPGRRVSALDWTIIALGLGLSLLLLAGGLLPARERNERIRQKNNALADDILDKKEDIERRMNRIRDRENDPLTIEGDLRDRGGLPPGEIPVPPKNETAPPEKTGKQEKP